MWIQLSIATTMVFRYRFIHDIPYPRYLTVLISRAPWIYLMQSSVSFVTQVKCSCNWYLNLRELREDLFVIRLVIVIESHCVYVRLKSKVKRLIRVRRQIACYDSISNFSRVINSCSLGIHGTLFAFLIDSVYIVSLLGYLDL